MAKTVNISGNEFADGNKKPAKDVKKTSPKKVKVVAEPTVKPKTKPTAKAASKTAPAIPQAGNKADKHIRLTLEIRFNTEFGQNLFVVGDHELLGNNDIAKALPLEFLHENAWGATIELDTQKVPQVINYRYFVKNADGSLIEEDVANKSIDLSASAGKTIYVSDFWSFSGFPAGLFDTKPFLILLDPNGKAKSVKKVRNSTHVFTVKAPVVEENQVLCILGSDVKMGLWEVKKAPMLYPVGNGNWQIELDLTKAVFPLQYKFGLFDAVNKKLVAIEGYENRHCNIPAIKDGKVFINEGLLNIAENA